MSDDPFAALGLPARAGLSDEDVRGAWRRIAAATHPDRDDGGDPARFGAAAAAYDTLRTPFGRGEALADLGLAGRGPVPAHRAAHPGGHSAARHARRTGVPRLSVSGRGWRLALRAAAGGGVIAAAFLAVGWTPATVGLLAGALTWAVTSISGLRGRGDG
jgi:curved DNA-binding protein CbpA